MSAETRKAPVAASWPPLAAGRWDMWRYRALLPLNGDALTYPLPVGGTPLIPPPELRKRLGMPHLWLKDETRGPTGSNKDRATALVLQHAMNGGPPIVSCASTGNVAVSLAVGAAAAGKRAVIFVPSGTNDAKLRLMSAAGAVVFAVPGGYAAAFRLSREAAGTFGWCDRNTGVNPLTVEAKKTVAFEIWEQLGREAPDAVVVPVGDGVTLAALARGFRELTANGAAPRLPRMIGVQSAECQPVVRAWAQGRPIAPDGGTTIADGIAVGAPVAGERAIRDVRESGGGFVAVPDRDILAAIDLLARVAGILAEPAGAAATAGLLQALRDGLVRTDERVVALVTGSALKSPQFLPPSPAVEEAASLDAVRRVLVKREMASPPSGTSPRDARASP